MEPRYAHYFVVVAEYDMKGDIQLRIVQNVTPPSNGRVIFDNEVGAWLSPSATPELFDADRDMHSHLMSVVQNANVFADTTTPEPF